MKTNKLWIQFNLPSHIINHISYLSAVTIFCPTQWVQLHLPLLVWVVFMGPNYKVQNFQQYETKNPKSSAYALMNGSFIHHFSVQHFNSFYWSKVKLDNVQLKDINKIFVRDNLLFYSLYIFILQFVCSVPFSKRKKRKKSKFKNFPAEFLVQVINNVLFLICCILV